MLSDCVQNVQWVNSNVDFWIVETDQGIVEENIKPLLSEGLFIWDEECMARVNDLIIFQEFLQRLNNFNSELEVVAAMSVYELTDILSLGWEFLDDRAVISQKMTHEELSEVFLELLHSNLRSTVGALTSTVVDIDLHSEVLAHMHGIGETVINWIQFL